jgi:hypothetical protein
VIYRDNEQPLKAIRVRIFKGNDERNEDFSGRPIETRLVAFTNNRGEFEVGGLAAGKYYIGVEGQGIAMPSGSGMRIPLPITAIPRREDFEEIVPRHDSEFTVDGTNTVEVEVRITRGGSISGKVIKPNGAAVAYARVTFISRDGSGSGPYMSRFSTQTDKDGSYRIENLPAGDYFVAALEDQPGNYEILARLRGEAQIVTYHPAASNVSDAAAVHVDAGRETGAVNITLVARSSFTVSGTVVRQRDGTPIGGATVLLRSQESDLSGPLVPGLAPRTTHADRQGRWSFTNVTEGSYVVMALAPNPPMTGAASNEPEEAYRQSRQRFLMTQEEVSVKGSDRPGLQLAISGPGSIVGRVEMDNGEALPADLVIFLELIAQDSRPGPPLPVRIQPGGAFVFNNIQAGNIFLSAAFPQNSKYFVKSMTADGEDTRVAPLKVVEGAEAGPLQIVLSTGLATISGRVVSEDGREGLSDRVVMLVPVDPGKQRFRTSTFAVRTTSDGSYALSIPPGDYFVVARSRDELPGVATQQFMRNLAGNAQRVSLGSSEQKRLDLRLR